jgi:hypothetical protein
MITPLPWVVIDEVRVNPTNVGFGECVGRKGVVVATLLLSQGRFGVERLFETRLSD